MSICENGMEYTLVFRERQVSHAREARGTRRWEIHRGLISGAFISYGA